MSDDLFTDEERRSTAYLICMGAAVFAGAAAGSIVGGAASLPTGGASLMLSAAGLGLGAAVGKKLCPMITNRALQRLEDPQARLSPAEVQGMVRGLRSANPRLSNQAALNHLAALRMDARRRSAA